MSQEDIANLTKERDQYKAILEVIVRNDCPISAVECLTRNLICKNCIMDYAKTEMEKICVSANGIS